jgi:carbon starvation protein
LAIGEAVVFGICVYKFKMKVSVASFIFVPVLFLLVWAGTIFPIDLTSLFGLSLDQARITWIVIILAYCFFASTLPVWLLLQPRDYLNSYLLYVMLILGVLGILFTVPTIQIDAFTGFAVANPKSGVLQHLFPLLFVTVACGACSGFHALVSSGTTSKQIDKESHIRPIGYGGMLVEGIVALIALIAVASLTQEEYMMQLKNSEPVQLFASNLAQFCVVLGFKKEIATSFMMLSVAAFLMTSVDSCTRLARFTWQELWTDSKKNEEGKTETEKGFALLMQNKYASTMIVVGIATYLLVGNPEISKNLWTLFASANQMLAALTLLTASLWLYKKLRNFWIALMPMLFMFITSGTAVAGLFKGNLDNWLKEGFQKGGVAAIASGILLILAVILLILGATNLRKLARERAKK